MALGFNRKKATDAAPDATPNVAPTVAAPTVATPTNPPTSASTPRADDLDAFDLEAFSAPSTETAASSSTSASAFDFPETTPATAPVAVDVSGTGANDPLDFDQLFEVEQRNAAATKNEAPAPFVPPAATMSEAATPFYPPQTPVVTAPEPQPKKKLPLLPILGALAVLGLAGGAASLLTRGSSEDETAALVTTPRVPRVPSEAAAAAVTTNPAPVVAAPRVAPQLPSGADPVNPGIAPAPGAAVPSSSAAAVAAPQLAQMKALWKLGAAAKKRGDYAGARRIWNQGLQIQPNNIGFQESIAKLPR